MLTGGYWLPSSLAVAHLLPVGVGGRWLPRPPVSPRILIYPTKRRMHVRVVRMCTYYPTFNFFPMRAQVQKSPDRARTFLAAFFSPFKSPTTYTFI